MTIRVMLADDHRMFRETLRSSLAAERDIEVIGEAGTGSDTLAILGQESLDVLLLDIGLPDVSGIKLAQTIAKQHSAVSIIALSGYADRIYIESMLKAGAAGYVVKSAGTDELIAAIRAVAKGKNYLSSEATSVMVNHFHDDRKQAPPSSVLGKREVEVLGLLASGKRSAQIAASLGIALGTVEVHRRNIKQKLGIFTVAGLTQYAIREQLIAPCQALPQTEAHLPDFG